MPSIRAHQRYRLRSGEIVPSVTVIIESQLGWNKRVLIAWARREALQGNDSELILLDTGSIGKVAHLLIQGFIEDFDPDIADFTQNQIAAGFRAFENFKLWSANRGIEFLEAEKRVVSEEFRFGGTLDILCRIDGVLSLVDIKTAKSLYPEFIVQVSAYGKALREQESVEIEKYHLLQLSKDGGGYQHQVLAQEKVEAAWEVFKHCRALYGLRKELT